MGSRTLWSLGSALVLACGEGGGDRADPAALEAALRSAPVPAAHQPGEQLFAARCAACHGELALGTAQGPPLVHPVYRPAHHADPAFQLAVSRGVRAHHWGFGDMPPVPDLAPAQVAEITGYVRWLQRTAGIE